MLASEAATSDVLIIGRGFLKDFSRQGGFLLSKRQKIIVANPDSKIWSLSRQELGSIDAFIVGSQEESWSLEAFGKPSFVIPQREVGLNATPRSHEKDEPLTLTYHGNKQHLSEIRTEVMQGIIDASELVKVRLRLIYDFSTLGKIRTDFPLEVDHVQWELSTFAQNVSYGNVGFVPNLLRYEDKRAPKLPLPIFGRRQPSQSLTFKRTSNMGRALVFADLGLPVIAEPSPSIVGLIPSRDYGHVVTTREGWRDAILELSDRAHRKNLSHNLRERVKGSEFDFEKLAISIVTQVASWDK